MLVAGINIKMTQRFGRVDCLTPGSCTSRANKLKNQFIFFYFSKLRSAPQLPKSLAVGHLQCINGPKLTFFVTTVQVLPANRM